MAPSHSTRLQCGAVPRWPILVGFAHVSVSTRVVEHTALMGFTKSVKLGRMPRMLEDAIRVRCDFDRLRL